MARNGCIRWICCWWLLLCGFLPSVEASTRIPITLPSMAAAVAGSTTATASGGTLTLGGLALEGEYIAAATGNVPVRGIIGGVEFGLNTVATTATSLLRANAASLLAGAAVAGLVDGVGWIMKDGVLTKPATGSNYVPSGSSYGWEGYGSDTMFATPQALCDSFNSSTYTGKLNPGTSDTGGGNCTLTRLSDGNVTNFAFRRVGSSCPSNFTYSSSASTCVDNNATSPSPVTDADYQPIADYINQKDAAWMKSLVQQLCAPASGGSSPDSCYKAMSAKSPKLTGPSTVSAGTTTSTKTVANADGTTSQNTTATTTNYAITYGDTYMDTNKNTTTTVTSGGQTVSTTTTAQDPTTETDADSDSNPTPSTCTSADCTAPIYTSLYTKTTDTKEAALDSYASKVAALPIMSAVSGFFTISVGGGCPTWTVNNSLDIQGASFPINLVMDEQCQPWFTGIASFAKYCIMIVAAFFAFKTAILD